MQVNRCRHADCHNRSSIGKTYDDDDDDSTASDNCTDDDSIIRINEWNNNEKALRATARTATPATQVRFGVDLGDVLWPFMGGELMVLRTIIIIINLI